MITVYEKEGVLCVEGVVEKVGRSVGTVFIFLIDGMLIDTGPQIIEKELIPFYKEHAEEIQLVALTHSHEDHTGTASWLLENLNVPIYVHQKGVEQCAIPCNYPVYRQQTWGVRKEFTALPFQETIQSNNMEWKLIYTPGHADDHVSILDEANGRIFTGDLFVHPKTKVIMDSESIPVIMDSIKKLLTYDFQSIYCGHSGYFADGKKVLKQKLEYLENLCGEVYHLHDQGLTYEEIRKKLFPTKYPIIQISGGEWDSLHIITSIINDRKLNMNTTK